MFHITDYVIIVNLVKYVQKKCYLNVLTLTCLPKKDILRAYKKRRDFYA